MYYSKKKTHSSTDEIRLIDIDGFLMKSKKGLKVQNQIINNIKVVNTSLANIPIEYELIKKYEKITNNLVDLIADDDGSGDSCREALNQIERFKLEIKNRYKNYINNETMKNMAIVLKKLKQDAEKRLLEINSYFDEKENGKSR